tara:strand:- start:36047 stop:36160 length:114 start_codon:yes stop_codon:yes gene_type:complete
MSKDSNESSWIFWLAVILSIVGIAAVILLALNAAGIV